MTAAIAPIASNGPAAAKAAGPSATPASPLSSAMAKHRQELGTLATTLPFFAYTACFAFGVERLTYALLCQKGLDVSKWDEKTVQELKQYDIEL